jgi:hypothetical protein
MSKNDKALMHQLNGQLSEFGLNPRDWVVKPVGTDRFKVEYTDDRNWYFIGTTKSKEKKTQWAQMQLASI